MQTALEQIVRRRAGHLCEYCLVPEDESALPFVMDHVIARQHGGETNAGNLALACGRCNLHKGPNVAGVDPETRQIIRLFNPRTDRWNDHFLCDGAKIVGYTAIGRATATVLAFNRPERIAVRTALIQEGKYPTAASG